MKLSAVPWVAAGAGLGEIHSPTLLLSCARCPPRISTCVLTSYFFPSIVLFQGAEAAPIRYTIVAHSFVGTTTTTTTSEGGGLPSFFRFGHVVGGGNMQGSPNPDQLKKPCGMHKMVSLGDSRPTLTLSDTLRQALGLEPIAEPLHKLDHGVKSWVPMHLDRPVITPSSYELVGSMKPTAEGGIDMWKAHPHQHMDDFHFKQSAADAESSFVHRLHFALNNLEAWEARAVAFVLGTFISTFDHPPNSHLTNCLI
jgi:hypothetical protein